MSKEKQSQLIVVVVTAGEKQKIPLQVSSQHPHNKNGNNAVFGW